MSEDAEAERGAVATRWRELEQEALDVARSMTDPEARRYMLFISERYRLLAQRAELRKDHKN